MKLCPHVAPLWKVLVSGRLFSFLLALHLRLISRGGTEALFIFHATCPFRACSVTSVSVVIVSDSLSLTLLEAYLRVLSFTRSSWTPFFLHFQHSPSPVIYCSICFEFSFPAFPLLFSLNGPSSSLTWTLCASLLLVSLRSLVSSTSSPPPTLLRVLSSRQKAHHSPAKSLQWLPFTLGTESKLLTVIIAWALVSHFAFFCLLVVVRTSLVQKTVFSETYTGYFPPLLWLSYSFFF